MRFPFLEGYRQHVQFRINGVAIANPLRSGTSTVYSIDTETGTGRDANGNGFRDKINEKLKFECEWPPLSGAELANILNLVSGEYFQLTYPDPRTNGTGVSTFYVGDRTAAIYHINAAGSITYTGLKMNFIER